MKPVTIVGGGLAGLALGIELRQQGVPAVVFEASGYPRHRVCGEFISGRGQSTLARLGLTGLIVGAGGRWARTAAFYQGGQLVARRELPQPALCLSRYLLDALLAREFCRLGGELRTGERWKGSFETPGIVRATGHRVEAVVEGWRWIGLKVHARNVPLEADLEMHIFPNGYVGACQLADRVNVCGLFRTREPIPDLRQRWRELLLAPWAEDARPIAETFCATAALSLTPRRMRAQECAIGDALTMIPPVTGNGMSLALESAELAQKPLLRFSHGDLDWGRTRRAVTAACDDRLRWRLNRAWRLQRMLFRPVSQQALVQGVRWFPPALSWLFRQTR